MSKKQKKHAKHAKGGETRRYLPVDRSKQGAALSGSPNISLDSTPDHVVRSPQSMPIMASNPDAPQAPKVQNPMTLTLKGLNKRGTDAIYTGAIRDFRIRIDAFVNKTPPTSFEVADGIFVMKMLKVAKVKLTKEQRAALPRPTGAEKIAKMEARLAKAKAKLEAKATDL